MSALKQLVDRLVDYAGLFPPAGLPLASVIKNYEKYCGGTHRWMLGHLIVPAARLPEFTEVFHQLLPDGIHGDPWQISALIPAVDAPDQGFEKSLESIAEFNDEFQSAQVDAVEGKLPRAELVDRTVEQIPESLTAFLEIPFADSADLIAKLAAKKSAGVYAKIRTGGVTPDLIPDSRQVAGFIAACAQSNLGFKATAGLHHPLRGEYPLTYHTDAEHSTMHGFLNVFVAACFAHQHNWSADQMLEILNTTEPESIGIGPERISFAGQSVDEIGIQNTRDQFAISFGSCSFTEPVDELQRPGWLEQDAAESAS